LFVIGMCVNANVLFKEGGEMCSLCGLFASPYTRDGISRTARPLIDAKYLVVYRRLQSLHRLL
jgi:hypothetical protein